MRNSVNIWGQAIQRWVRSSEVTGSILEEEESRVGTDKVLMSLSPGYGAIKEIERYSQLHIWGGGMKKSGRLAEI